MDAEAELKLEIQKVKSGEVRNFGFLKGNGGQHGLVVTKKAISGAVEEQLRKDSGATGKPIKGIVRYDEADKLVLFLTKASPGTLKGPLKEALQKAKVPIGSWDVRQSDIADDAVPGAGTGTVSQKSLATIRLSWDQARKKAEADLGKLQETIKQVYKGSSNYATVEKRLPVLNEIVTKLDTYVQEVTDTLDNALNATPEKQPAMIQAARNKIGNARGFLDSHPVAVKIDGNPFVPVTVRKGLLEALQLMELKLA